MADTIEYFARIVKQMTNGKALFGSFYGYQLHPMTIPQADSGHYALGKLLSSPYVDYLCSPTCYTGRELGTGYSYFMSLTASVSLHGKLWFDENDIRTHLSKREGFGKTNSLKDTISMQWREMGNVIAHGVGMWWMDLYGTGWYDDPGLLTEINKMSAVAGDAINHDRSNLAEIAVIIDEESEAVCKPNAGLQSYDDIVPIGHIGAPVDFLLLEDLPKARPYKLYFFKYAYRYNARIAGILDKVVKRGGHLVLWLDRPGIVDTDEGGISNRNIERMTGLKMDPDLPGLILNSDKALEQKLGMQCLQMGEWTSIYTPKNPTADELRRIAKAAGVHIYLDTGDVVYANRSYLCIHTNEGGTKHIRLPHKTPVRDLINNKEISPYTDEFSIEIPAKSTALYLLGENSH